MLKRVIFIMLALSPFVYYGSGYVGNYEFGRNTLFFGSFFFLIWWLCLIIYLMTPKKFGAAFKLFVLFACFMTFSQLVIQVDLRSRGIAPDNNWMSIPSCLLALVISYAIYRIEKKLNGGSS